MKKNDQNHGEDHVFYHLLTENFFIVFFDDIFYRSSAISSSSRLTCRSLEAIGSLSFSAGMYDKEPDKAFVEPHSHDLKVR